jgi:uncharacterized protein YbjT (DUF2867 family)
MNILLIGGTGTVGSQTVRELLGRNVQPRVLTRSAEKVGQLPAGVHGVVGDLAEPDTLPPALRDTERLILITPLTPSEAVEGLRAVRLVRAAGVRRIVFMSIHDVEKVPEAPHFSAKIAVQHAIRESGIPWTFIMPNNFYQNDLWFKQPILDSGVYPQPFGEVGMSRVDVRDIAEALANATLEDGHASQRYPLVGPDVLTAEATAAAWGRHLGRDVRYAGNDLDAWEAQTRKIMPDWAVDDWLIMYRYFQRNGLRATDEDLRQQARILKHPPRRFEDFVKETAAAWRGRTATASG